MQLIIKKAKIVFQLVAHYSAQYFIFFKIHCSLSKIYARFTFLQYFMPYENIQPALNNPC